MAKLFVALVAIAALGYLGYRAMGQTKVDSVTDKAAHAPKRQLDNVRTRAQEIEAETQQRADDVAKKAAE